MGRRLELTSDDAYSPVWILNFPLMEWDEEEKRYFALHHPFTSPISEDVGKLDTDPASVKANAYDLVINGVELGGGSIRIHKRDLQQQVFECLGMDKKEVEEKFGFLLTAFDYGAPPHGGIAFGFDRICALFGGTESIRDYIAFPKNNAGKDVMINTPSKIDQMQLKGLHLSIK